MPLVRERPYYVEEGGVTVEHRPNLIGSVLWSIFVLACAAVFYLGAAWLMQFVFQDMQRSFASMEALPPPVMQEPVPTHPGNRPVLRSSDASRGEKTTTTTTTSVRQTTEVSRPVRVPGT